MRGRGSFLATATVGLLLVAPAAAQAADAYVDFETGVDGPTCGAMGSPCKTIPTGIDNAGNNETVRVDDTMGTYTGGGLNLGFGKSLVAQEFVEGDENALAEPDTIIDMGLATFFPAISVPPGGGGGTIQGFVIRSQQNPVSLRSSTTLTGNRIDEEAGFSTCQVQVMDSGNNSVIGPGNTFIDPTPTTNPQAGVCTASSATPTVTSNTFSDLIHAVQSGGGNSTISSNIISGTRGTNEAIEVTAGVATITANLIQNPADGTLAEGIRVEQTGPVVGATLRRNTILGHRVGVAFNDTGAPVDMNGDLIAKSTNAGLAINDSAATGDANVSATNVTVTDSGGVEISVQNAELTLNSSIVGPLGITAGGAVPLCMISFSRGPTMTPGGNGCANFQTTAAAGFANPAANDYHLATGSPMIDSGDPATPMAGILDLDAGPRATDGNGDGIVRRDIGADETATLVLPPATPTTSPSPAAAPKKKKCKHKKRAKGAAAKKKCKRKRGARK